MPSSSTGARASAAPGGSTRAARRPGGASGAGNDGVRTIRGPDAWIDALSPFVLRTVLERLLAWEAIGQSSVSLAINVSPMQFNSARLVDETLSAIEASGLSG